MSIRFRVMVTGEDGMDFCYANNLKGEDIPTVCDEAQRSYPEGNVYYERETPIYAPSNSEEPDT